MLDKLLLWRLRRGDKEALACIYSKYKQDLLTIAAGLLHNKCEAEDIVHELFVDFVKTAGNLEFAGTLRGYLAVAVANRARNSNRNGFVRRSLSLDEAVSAKSKVKEPPQWAIYNEDFTILNDALAELPYEQKEVVMLHTHGKLKFREIAELQQTSSKTVQSRYRYALDKLRLILDREVPK